MPTPPPITITRLKEEMNMGYTYTPFKGEASLPKPPARKERIVELPTPAAKRAFIVDQDPEMSRPENMGKLKKAVEALPPVIIIGTGTHGDSVTLGDE